MKKTTIIAAAAALASLALAGTASADSVTYVGSDGNVYVASPDGKTKAKVTTTGAAGSPFRSPTAKNDGTIAAIRSGFVTFHNPKTAKQTDAWILPKTGAGSFAPFNGGQISPDGGMMVFDWRYFDCATNPCQGNQRVSFISGPGTTNPCLINCHVGWVKPRWIPGTPYAGMVSQSYTQIGVQKAGAASPVAWLVANQPDQEIIDSFDVSSKGQTLVETSAPGGGASNLILFQNNGTPPDGNPQALCVLEGFAGAGADPRWSPDGSKIAWTGAAGVYTSPAPVANGGACALQPKLIAPGADDASWGLQDAPKEVAGSNGKAKKKCKAKKAKKGAVSAKKKGCKKRKKK